MSKQSVLASLLALTAAGCVSYENNQRFQDWLAVAETECSDQYGTLPISSQEDRDAFMELIYATYSGTVPREIFADRMQIRYPNNGLTIDCLANSFSGPSCPGCNR